jgi:hypothetical protein
VRIWVLATIASATIAGQIGRLLVEERSEPIQVGESINRPLQLY